MGCVFSISHEPNPLTPSLSPTGGEGARRAGEGDSAWFMVPMRVRRTVDALSMNVETRDTVQLGTSGNQSSADFADFQIRGPSELHRAADFEVGDSSSVARLAKRLRLSPELLRRVDTAGLETCATDEVSPSQCWFLAATRVHEAKATFPERYSEKFGDRPDVPVISALYDRPAVCQYLCG